MQERNANPAELKTVWYRYPRKVVVNASVAAIAAIGFFAIPFIGVHLVKVAFGDPLFEFDEDALMEVLFGGGTSRRASRAK